MKSCNPTPKQETAPAAPPDPRGRLDLLLLRLGDKAAAAVSSKIGVDLWGGPDGIRAFAEGMLSNTGLAKPIDLTPKGIAEHLFENRPKQRRKRGRRGV